MILRQKHSYSTHEAFIHDCNIHKDYNMNKLSNHIFIVPFQNWTGILQNCHWMLITFHGFMYNWLLINTNTSTPG